ncbi:MAG: hypothetical protein JRI39_00465 [Deltaproteobacteria bacterium]|nr:hypothetical protein [Deltaproteobacteria bacterium]
MFDPATFLNTAVDGQLSTEYVVIPEGEYIGRIREIQSNNFRLIETKNGPQWVLDLTWEFDDPEVAKITHRKVSTARQTIWLELTPEGKLDTSEGTNVQLGRVREAVGQKETKDWTISMLSGAMARCQVVHRQSSDGTRTYPDVQAVAAL